MVTTGYLAMGGSTDYYGLEISSGLGISLLLYRSKETGTENAFGEVSPGAISTYGFGDLDGGSSLYGLDLRASNGTSGVKKSYFMG